MVWGAFSSKGALELQFVTSRMNSADYIDVLKKSLVPYLRRFRRMRFTYQHDNARIHVSRETSEWLKTQRVDILNWPACSPDINPMENLWAIMVRRIYADNKQYVTVDELKVAILDAWRAIEPSIINNLINSMDNRVFQLINRSGKLTDY